MLGRQMRASDDAQGRLEEQKPFLEVDVEDTANSRASAPEYDKPSTRRYSYLYSAIFILLGSTFIISAIWHSPSEYQCVHQLNVWCKKSKNRAHTHRDYHSR
jgi:hypothetical protein